MIFEQFTVNGCQSYLVGCEKTCAAVLIDPEFSLLHRYEAIAAKDGLRIVYVIDTHTHADHFTAAKRAAEAFGAQTVMGARAPAPHIDLKLDDGDTLAAGDLRLTAMYTPGHTRDSMCLVMNDRVFTGDTLLIGGTGRTDLPSGDAEALYDSLFNKLLKLDPALLVYPAHDYKGRTHSTIGDELKSNPRLQKRDKGEFVEMMRTLNLSAPTHLTEALRVNMSGGSSVAQMLADAAATVPFMSMESLRQHVATPGDDLLVLDVRERDAYEAAHIPGAKHLPRGQLELRVNEALPDPTRRIVTYCEFGKVSTLAAATLRQMGFTHASGLDGGMKAWTEKGFPVETGPAKS